MSFITVLATVCHVVAGNTVEACVEEIVVDNTLDPMVTMQSCMMGMSYVAKWMNEHPVYHTGNWRLHKWSCRIGNKPAPDPGGKA
jgi:hypothetical protein